MTSQIHNFGCCFHVVAMKFCSVLTSSKCRVLNFDSPYPTMQLISVDWGQKSLPQIRFLEFRHLESFDKVRHSRLR